MDLQELRERQSWTLRQKIDHSLGVIDQFVSRLNGQVYVGFSGGKDSTVLLDLCRIVKPDIKAVFCNTGNEYPDIVRFVRELKNTEGYDIEIIYPTLKPAQVFEKYGFPVVSKSTSAIIGKVRRTPNGKVFENFVVKRHSIFKLAKKWMFLIDVKFDISEKCCYQLKKKPFHEYHIRRGQFPISGEMASESIHRQMKYLQAGGCNQFGDTTISKPLSIWLEEDIWAYIRDRGLKISDIYHKGAKRTGCMFCGYGCQFKDDNRLQLCYELYPKMYNHFMNYTNNGVTYREAMRQVLAVNGLFLPDEKPKTLFD